MSPPSAGHFALALAVFGLATAGLYAPAWREGVRESIPSRSAAGRYDALRRSDHQFVVWAVARNARTLATHPSALFDAEACFPDAETLALGEPVIAMGLLGVPVWLATRDPVLVYNVVLVLMTLTAALAMYWLVVAWTGVPAAAIAAGLLFALSAPALVDPVHPYSSYTTPMVLCLFFAERLLARGQWRDAVGLSLAGSLEIATSFYPLLASVAVGLPFVLWLLIRRPRRLRPAQVAFVLLSLALATWLFLGPYLEARAAGLLGSVVQDFAPPSVHLPGGSSSFGLLGLLLALIGLALPRRFSLARITGDPRLPLLSGAAFVTWLAAGPEAGLDLYGALATFVPGLETVRLPRKLVIGVPLVLSILAGIGFAGLVRLVAERRPRLATIGGHAVLAGVFVAGFGAPEHYTTFHVRPRDETLEFYATLAELGNRGPIYETPIPLGPRGRTWSLTAAYLLSATWHERQTSACYPSHPHRHRAEIDAIEAQLPSGAAVAALQRLGFTTVVVHQSETALLPGSRAAGFAELADAPRGPLRLLLRQSDMAAYEISAR